MVSIKIFFTKTFFLIFCPFLIAEHRTSDFHYEYYQPPAEQPQQAYEHEPRPARQPFFKRLLSGLFNKIQSRQGVELLALGGPVSCKPLHFHKKGHYAPETFKM